MRSAADSPWRLPARHPRTPESISNRPFYEGIKIGVVRHVYTAATDSEAEDVFNPAYSSWFHKINYLFARAESDRLQHLSDPRSVREAGLVIAGSPDTVRQQVQRTIDETGCNYFCGIFAFGDLSTDQIMASMHLFVNEVMPAFRSGS